MRFILTDPCPPVPAANASRAVRNSYDQWISANNRAIGYILASMSDMLRSKMERMDTAVEILEALHEIFGK